MEIHIHVDRSPGQRRVSRRGSSFFLDLEGLRDGDVLFRWAWRGAAKRSHALVEMLRAGGGESREEEEGFDVHGEAERMGKWGERGG